VSNNKVISERAKKMLNRLSNESCQYKEEFRFSGAYTINSLRELPYLTSAIVTKAMSEMESSGYIFTTELIGKKLEYALTIENVVDIYKHRGIKSYRELHEGGFVLCISSLKGGVSKSVTSVSVAQSLRVHPQLIKYDLRILVIDIDPQGSATMLLNSKVSNGVVNNTAVQAMIQNLSRQILKEEFILKSNMPNVDVIPASIDDGLLENDWEEICAKYLPEQNIHAVLRENIVNKLKDDYDFIIVDGGTHLDSLFTNSLAAADLLLTPIVPAKIDFNSTLKYISILPELTSIIEESGCPMKTLRNVGFMTKLANKTEHKIITSLAKEVFQDDMLDVNITRSDAFEYAGETFDTVISCVPSNYAGSKKSLKKARKSIENFSISLFSRIQILRGSFDE